MLAGLTHKECDALSELVKKCVEKGLLHFSTMWNRIPGHVDDWFQVVVEGSQILLQEPHYVILADNAIRIMCRGRVRGSGRQQIFHLERDLSRGIWVLSDAPIRLNLVTA
jgi:hypothetical protein